MTTDEKLRRLEARLQNLYRDAEEEMRGKWDEYMSRQEKKAERLRARILQAKTPADKLAAEAAYREHLNAVTSGSAHFRDMVRSLAANYANANQRALAIINGKRSEFFADGYNLSAEEINGAAIDADVGIRFDLVDASTIEWLVERTVDEPEKVIMPPPEKLKIPEDERWSAKLIQSQVAQGIAQGESIPKIAKRLEKVTDNEAAACIRRARTMVTDCENAGRVRSMKQAEEMGVRTRKQWVCTHDDRTRDTHLQLDGETIDKDDVFWNGCRWPGDHLGPPAEVWNCRCTLVTVVDGFDSTLPRGKQGAIRVRFGGEEEKDADIFPKIAGVSRGKAMDHAKADSGRVNPNFGVSRAYGINCQSCVVTYEARRRGYDVEVVPNDGAHPMCRELSFDARLAWKNPDGSRAEFLPGFGDGKWHYSGAWIGGEKPTANRMEKKLIETLEEGGRYEMGFPWKGRSQAGHIVTVKKENGELVMYDPQSNRTARGKDFSAYLQDIKYEKTFNGEKYYSYPRILRVDDKELDFDVANQIMREA